jgi:hypothetical protein
MMMHGIMNVNTKFFLVGYTVAQFVEALHYKPEGRVFHSRRSHWSFSLT